MCPIMTQNLPTLSECPQRTGFCFRLSDPTFWLESIFQRPLLPNL